MGKAFNIINTAPDQAIISSFSIVQILLRVSFCFQCFPIIPLYYENYENLKSIGVG